MTRNRGRQEKRNRRGQEALSDGATHRLIKVFHTLVMQHPGETKVSVETGAVETVCKKEIVTLYKGPMIKQIQRNTLR